MIRESPRTPRSVPPGDRADGELVLRPLERADAPRVAALFSDVFGRPRAAAEVVWKLFDTPADPAAPPAFVAERDGRLVGQYAGTPTRFLVDGRERVGLHGCDVMTAAAFRRRGVLTALGTRAHRAWRKAGLVFVTGLVSDAWGSRAAALSWVELFPLRWLTAALVPEAVLARRLGLPALARLSPLGATWRAVTAALARRDPSVSVEEVRTAGEELDGLWAGCRDRLGVSVVRDRRWVEWRYLRAPGTRYRVLVARRRGRAVGYLAWTVGDATRGIVAEVFTAPDDGAARSTLLREACDRMRAAGAEVASLLAVPASPLWETCRRACFLPASEYVFEVVHLDAGVDRGSLADPGLWTLAGGDFDVV